MAAITECEVTDLKTFTEILQQSMQAAGNPLWSRGCTWADYNLVPTLYRHPGGLPIDGLMKLEGQLMARFRQRALPYLDRDLRDVWDTIFYMQHFSVPTRLLDWTENPFMALFFATAIRRFDDRSHPSKAAAVWLLDPTKWNNHALRHMSFQEGAIDTSHTATTGYAPGTPTNELPASPIAVYGMHNSKRIVAQRGVFTVFGKLVDPMENLYASEGFPDGSLTKIVIPEAAVATLADSLISIGVTDSVVFPDLDGLARELRRQFGFGG